MNDYTVIIDEYTKNEYTVIVELGSDSVSIEAGHETEALALVKEAYLNDYGKIANTFTYEIEGA